MPRSKSGKIREGIDSDTMLKAIQSITDPDENSRISIREAAKIFKISPATLSRQSKIFRQAEQSAYLYKPHYDVKRVFSIEEENSLVDYITTIAKMNYGLSKKGVRELAFKFAVANSKSYPQNWDEECLAGEEWMRHFMSRNSEKLSIRKPEATSLARSTSFNKKNIEDFFNNIKRVHDRYGPIPPQRIWNIDETGLMTVQVPSKIVAPKGIKQIGKTTSAERGQLVTMIAAISAAGNQIPPMLIFPRVFFKEFMLKGAPPGTIGNTNPSGWSNENLFLEYLKHFVEHTQPSEKCPVLLLIDNHESHLSYEAVQLARKEGIVMVTFPPHTSNKLQPLNLTVYGPLKTYYNQAVDEWLKNNPGKTFDIYSISEAIGKIYYRTFSSVNITNGFKTAGIFPLAQGIFTDEDFLVSSVTDRVAPDVEVRRPTVEDNLNGGQIAIASTSTEDRILPRIVSPAEIQPFPKANVTKVTNRGRKPGRTRIVTDTPEKIEIKRLKKEKKKKKTLGKKQNIKKKLAFESSSEDDISFLHSSTESLSTIKEIIEQESKDKEEEDNFEKSTFEINDYVLVQFCKKKGLPDHYVGLISDKDTELPEFKIKFLKRIKKSQKFLFDSDEIFDVHIDDLLCKLPNPNNFTGRSTRVGEQLVFQVDFEGFNVT